MLKLVKLFTMRSRQLRTLEHNKDSNGDDDEFNAK